MQKPACGKAEGAEQTVQLTVAVRKRKEKGKSRITAASGADTTVSAE